MPASHQDGLTNRCTEVVAAGERFEGVFCRAGIDQHDPVRGAEAEVQPHPSAMNKRAPRMSPSETMYAESAASGS